MVDSYIANSQQNKAITYLSSLRTSPVPSTSSPAVPAAAPSSSSSASSPAPSVKAGAKAPSAKATASPSGEGAAADLAKGGSVDPKGGSIDPVNLELLAGKAYGAWRGHDGDALSVYDGLIASRPEDYRGYLAKGVFFKERGRKADAERMFIQVPGCLGVHHVLMSVEVWVCTMCSCLLKFGCAPRAHVC